MITIFTTPIPHWRTLTSSSGIGVISSVTVSAILRPAITHTRAVVEVMMAVSVIAVIIGIIVVMAVVSRYVCIETSSIATAAVAAVRGTVVISTIRPSWL